MNPLLAWRMYRNEAIHKALLADFDAVLVASSHMRTEFKRNGVNPEILRVVRLPLADGCRPPDLSGKIPGGRLLFTASAQPAVWNDVMTGLESISLGAEQYRKLLLAAGLSVAQEYEDEGQNHYFDALRER